MKTTLLALMLLSLALTGCVIDPNAGYRDRNYGDRDWNHGEHADNHAEQGPFWAH
jgi:hypothetical protein